jgi:hypothetical protein
MRAASLRSVKFTFNPRDDDILLTQDNPFHHTVGQIAGFHYFHKIRH